MRCHKFHEPLLVCRRLLAREFFLVPGMEGIVQGSLQELGSSIVGQEIDNPQFVLDPLILTVEDCLSLGLQVLREEDLHTFIGREVFTRDLRDDLRVHC